MTSTNLRQMLPAAVAAVALITTGGCQGWLDVSTPGNDSKNRGESSAPNPTEEPTESSDPPACEGEPTPGPSSMRRLTAYEYRRTVDRLLPHVESLPSIDFNAEEEIGSFDANVVASVGDLTARQYRDTARKLAEHSTDSDGDLPDLLPCKPQKTDDSCAKSFIRKFGLRAFRRPLTDDEISRWLGVYEAGEKRFDVETGARMVVTGMLQSPEFLYRRAVGEKPSPGEDVVKLTDFELANRLSYLLWGSMPDDKLIESAKSGRLTDDPDEIRAQAERMLDHRLAREHLTHVVRQWLGVEDLAKVDSAGDHPELVESMRREIVAFIDHVLWEEEGSFETLMTAPYSFVDGDVAALYGEKDSVGSKTDGLVKLRHDGSRRKGILTLPGVIAAHSYGEHSIFRGKFLTQKFLCTTIPEKPPQDVIEQADPPETHEDQSARSKAEARMNHSYCGSCHKPMDGAGLVFSPYDSMGRYREQDDEGRSLTSRGHIHSAGELNGSVEGVDQLAERLADSDRVRSCVTRHFFTYAFARQPDQKKDACALKAMRNAMKSNDGDLRSLLIEATTTDAFQYRKLPKK